MNIVSYAKHISYSRSAAATFPKRTFASTAQPSKEETKRVEEMVSVLFVWSRTGGDSLFVDFFAKCFLFL